MSMFNPPTVQAGKNACYGTADPIQEFGDTPDTEKLILRPDVQKKLLKGDVPYQCKLCKLVFFVERWIIQSYSKEYYNWSNVDKAFRPPRGLYCKNSHYVIDRSRIPAHITQNLSLGTAIVSPITIPVTTITGSNNNVS